MKTRKQGRVGLAESIMNQCIILYNNLRSVVKVDIMCRLRDNFLFILGMLNSLGSQCDVMPMTIYHASYAYYPLLVDMRKDEALNIIYDMFKVTERIKFSPQVDPRYPTTKSFIQATVYIKYISVCCYINKPRIL